MSCLVLDFLHHLASHHYAPILDQIVCECLLVLVQLSIPAVASTCHIQHTTSKLHAPSIQGKFPYQAVKLALLFSI